MKRLPLLLSAFVALPLTLFATAPKQQMDAAKKQAAEHEKDLLMIFAGSEWQQASQDFENAVLKTEAFKKGIEKDFVQVSFDYPRERSEAHKDLLELQQTYRFREMPSIVLADLAGRPYAYLGAREEEPAACLKHLAESHKVRVERDRLFDEAAQTKGVERAQLLVKALKTMPQDMVRDFYASELAAIANADPKEKTGYVKQIQTSEALRQEQERFGMLLRNKQYDEVITRAKAEGAKLKGEAAQRLKLYEIQALAAKKEFDKAAQEVGEMTKMAPDSGLGKRSERYLSSLTRAKARHERIQEVTKRPARSIVSKPVAIVTDINAFKKETKEAEDATSQAIEHEKKLKQANAAVAQKISALEAELKKLHDHHKKNAAALKKAAIERERLALRSKAMREVVGNHEAIDERKRDISELEKRAVELQKQAEDLREKAETIQKNK